MQALITKKTHQPIVLIVILITILSQAVLTLYLPSLPLIAHELHTSTQVMQLTLTLYLIGAAIAQLIYGPLSDRYGRKYPLLIGLGVFIMGCLIASLASTSLQFLLSRLIQGLGAGATLTLGRSILRDHFSGQQLASQMAYLSMAFAIGLGVAPLIGAYATHHFHWRSEFNILASYTLIVMMIIYLYYHDQKNHKPLNSQKHQSTIHQPRFYRYTVASLCVYTFIITYNTVAVFLFETYWHQSPTWYAWLTLAVGASYFIGAVLNRYCIRRWSIKHSFYLGLLLIACSILLIALGTVWYSAAEIVTGIACMSLGGAQGLMFTNTISSALQQIPSQQAGTASSILTFLQLLFASLVSLMLSILHVNSPHRFLLALMVLMITCMICFKWCWSLDKPLLEGGEKPSVMRENRTTPVV